MSFFIEAKCRRCFHIGEYEKNCQIQQALSQWDAQITCALLKTNLLEGKMPAASFVSFTQWIRLLDQSMNQSVAFGCLVKNIQQGS